MNEREEKSLGYLKHAIGVAKGSVILLIEDAQNIYRFCKNAESEIKDLQDTISYLQSQLAAAKNEY